MLTLTGGLQSRGHSVRFITFTGRGAGSELRRHGETVDEVYVRTKLDPFAIAAMAKKIRSSRSQIVHTHLSTSSVNGCLAAKLAKVPSFATVHGMSGKLSFVFADQLLAVSEEVKNHLVSQGVKPSRIKVIYNGVVEEQASESEVDQLRVQLGLSGTFPVLGTVARVTRLKGIADAIKAVHHLKFEFPDIRYLVLGTGDDLQNCEELVGDLGLQRNVHFLGYQHRTAPYLKLMDIFIFPSYREAMGIALVEAALQGVPCVATNIGGIPEVVAKGSSQLVNPGDIEAMVKQVTRLANDPALRLTVSQNEQELARQKFSVDTMVESTLVVYESMLAHRHAIDCRYFTR